MRNWLLNFWFRDCGCMNSVYIRLALLSVTVKFLIILLILMMKLCLGVLTVVCMLLLDRWLGASAPLAIESWILKSVGTLVVRVGCSSGTDTGAEFLGELRLRSLVFRLLILVGGVWCSCMRAGAVLICRKLR